jgi:AraC-like DNA-binding protein
MGIIFIIGIAQGIFFALLLITKSNNQIANRILSFWMFLICFSLFVNYFYITGLIQKVPHLTGLDSPLPFLYPPIIFLYTSLLTKRKATLNRKDILHLLPFLIFFLYMFFNFYLRSGNEKYNLIKSIQFGPIPVEIQIANYLKIFQAAIYLIIVFQMIQKHQIRIKQEFSFTEKINLTWLKIIVFSLIVIYFFKFIGMLTNFINIRLDLAILRSLTDLLIILFIYIIAFYGLKQPEIFSQNSLITSETNQNGLINNSTEVESQIKKKYANSPLSDDESKQLLIKLQHYMETEKPYLQAQLSIKDIADKLEINTKYLSQVINELLGLNFFNFINQYRVEEVKKRLLDNKYKHFSIIGIALDCGFNSKSSFNSIFKRFTNQTPSNYISIIS